MSLTNFELLKIENGAFTSFGGATLYPMGFGCVVTKFCGGATTFGCAARMFGSAATTFVYVASTFGYAC